MALFGKLFLIIALMLPLGMVAAQDEEVDTSDWVVNQGEQTYVSAPPDWINLNDEDAIGQAIEDISELNPDLQTMMDAARTQLDAGLFDLFVADALSGANLNVAAVDLGSELPLEMLESMLAAQYEALNAEVEDTAFVELPGGEAIRVQVAMSINLPGGSENLLHQIQYILTQDTSMYVLTFSVEAAQFEAYLPTFDAIAESFGIGEAPDGNTAERPPASDLPPEGRSDIVRHDTPWINIVAPSDWFAARDVDAFAEHIATNGGHPMATPFFETLAGDVASGTWSYILVEPNDLAYMTLLVNEMGADIPVSTFQTPQEDIVKEDPDITFIDGSLITTPSGDAVRIEVTRPIRAGEIHHELRVFWMENQSLFYMILAVPEAVYPEYEQIFEDIINTVSFPDQ